MKSKQLVLFLTTLLLVQGALAQWRYHNGGNPFDGDYKSAFIKSPEIEGNGSGTFSIDLWNDDDLDVHFKGIDFGTCRDVTVEVNFNEDKYVYEVIGSKVEDQFTIAFGNYLISLTQPDTIMMYDFVNKLRASRSFWVRVQNGCDGIKHTYKFGLSGSSNAINAVLDQRQIRTLKEESDRLADAIHLYRESNEQLSRSGNFTDVIFRSTIAKRIEQFYNCPVCQPMIIKNKPGDSLYVLNHYSNGKTLVQLPGDVGQFYIPNAGEHIEGDMAMKAMLVAIKNRWTD